MVRFITLFNLLLLLINLFSIIPSYNFLDYRDRIESYFPAIFYSRLGI